MLGARLIIFCVCLDVASAAFPCGINGFGRIGRMVTRIMIDDPRTDLKAINTGAAAEYMAYQFKYDSIHGIWKGSVEVKGDDLIINGQTIKTTHIREPSEIPWGAMGVDYLCESSGQLLTAESCHAHIKSGAKKIILTAPAKDKSQTIVMGVNQNKYTSDMQVVSAASSTTNGLAPMVKAIHDAFEIQEGMMTTVHAMTSTQHVVDGSSKKDWRGGRGASANIIPSATGAAKAVTKVIPSLKGKLTGMAFRVPTVDVSVVDLTCKLGKATTYDELAAEVKRRTETDMKGILGYTEEDLVSQDFVSNPLSSIFDAKAGIMLNPQFVKVVAWYDNEWGYSSRVVDLMCHMAEKDGAKKRRLNATVEGPRNLSAQQEPQVQTSKPIQPWAHYPHITPILAQENISHVQWDELLRSDGMLSHMDFAEYMFHQDSGMPLIKDDETMEAMAEAGKHHYAHHHQDISTGIHLKQELDGQIIALRRRLRRLV